jgi:leucyl aminopeptidase
MNFDLKTLNFLAAVKEKADLLVVAVDDGFVPGTDALSSLIGLAIKNGDFSTKAGQSLSVYQIPAVAARKVILVGVGSASAQHIRQGIASVASAFKLPAIKRVVVCLPACALPDTVEAAVLAVSDACYVYNHTKPKAEVSQVNRVIMGVPSAPQAQVAFDRGLGVAAGVLTAREWGNRPANHATPTLLAQTAKALARQPRIVCKVLGLSEVKRLGMGAFMAVAQGSDQPLQFIELRYNGASKKQAPVVLVGKGITFDTGGISIKPAPEMDEMKFDMCGAASVLGVFQSLAQLQPDINVVGLIPACENMPDGKAIKPGDVVTTMKGLTIEILNTDAEGRLVLADALAYAEQFKPAAVIDIATLTGACVIALGALRSGLFSTDDALAQALQTAGDAAQDKCWRMPLDEDYAEGLKSNFADMGNVAGRAGGSITAAKFLQRFAPSAPWAHLDIAGAAWKSGAAKGATGRPVSLLVHYLLSLQQGAKVDNTVPTPAGTVGAKAASALTKTTPSYAAPAKAAVASTGVKKSSSAVETKALLQSPSKKSSKAYSKTAAPTANS